MKKKLIRFVIASGVALAGFTLAILVAAGLYSNSADTPVLHFLPDVQGVQARIMITPEIKSEVPFPVSMHVLFVSGHIGCTAGETAHVEVSVRQSSTGAYAVGASTQPCSGDLQIWDAVATIRGSSPLVETGPAWACAVATTRKHGQVTDTFTWCKQVMLAEK